MFFLKYILMILFIPYYKFKNNFKKLWYAGILQIYDNVPSELNWEHWKRIKEWNVIMPDIFCGTF